MNIELSGFACIPLFVIDLNMYWLICLFEKGDGKEERDREKSKQPACWQREAGRGARFQKPGDHHLS